MSGVTFGLADFVTGGPILDLPVNPGASWSSLLNRPDSLSCSIDMRDPDTLALDLPSSSEPRKTVLLARNDADTVLAWGIIDDDREWDEDTRTVKLTAQGVEASWFGASVIGPASALTAELVLTSGPNAGKANPALDTNLAGLSLGTIGKRLIQQRLAWPGAPSRFILPADEAGEHERAYPFASFKSIGEALKGLTEVEGGPDFAFDARRAADGLRLDYPVRIGTAAQPRIGVHAGVWSIGPGGPVSGLKVGDSAKDMGTAAWASAGRSTGEVLMSRALNEQMIADGYPPLDYVDTSRTDVTRQSTLDAYARGARRVIARPIRSLSFSVRGDATPGLGQFRVGDYVTLDVPDDHPWLRADIEIRITSIEGDGTGTSLKIGCDVV